MNPADLSTALLYGIPVVLFAEMFDGFDAILARRERSPHPDAAATRTREKPRVAVARDDGAALHITVAKRPEHFAAAWNLIRERYAWRGYEIENTDDARAQSRQHSSQEITFLVASGHATVGTLTLGLDGAHGLRAEETYGDAIDPFRSAGHSICEVTHLALAEHVDSKAVLASLFSLAHAVARTQHEVTDVFIEVNPRHFAFYSRVLGFRIAAGEKFCERVRAPSLLLHLELEALELRLGLLDVAALMQPLVAHAA